MLGCILLAIELLIAVFAPFVGIPLILITLAVMVVVGVARGAGKAAGAAAAAASRGAERPEPSRAIPAGALKCARCGLSIYDATESVSYRGESYHPECWSS